VRNGDEPSAFTEMAIMVTRSINPIIRPCSYGLPLDPCIGIGEKISRAIELMVSHNLRCIAVVHNRRAVGMVSLEEAFEEIGLDMPAK
jgi:CBS domain-containing protein